MIGRRRRICWVELPELAEWELEEIRHQVVCGVTGQGEADCGVGVEVVFDDQGENLGWEVVEEVGWRGLGLLLCSLVVVVLKTWNCCVGRHGQRVVFWLLMGFVE